MQFPSLPSSFNLIGCASRGAGETYNRKDEGTSEKKERSRCISFSSCCVQSPVVVFGSSSECERAAMGHRARIR